MSWGQLKRSAFKEKERFEGTYYGRKESDLKSNIWQIYKNSATENN